MTYIKVKGHWTYFYRAVDSTGKTIDFMLSEKRDAKAVERFFQKALSLDHVQKPRVKRTNPMLGFKSFETAVKTIEGIETIHMIKKGQVKLKNLSAPF